jgi:hypothetical protein
MEKEEESKCGKPDKNIEDLLVSWIVKDWSKDE